MLTIVNTRELQGKWLTLARDAMIRTEEHRLELDELQDTALTTANAVSPVGAKLEESLHALPMWVVEVVTHGVPHGATTTLAVVQL